MNWAELNGTKKSNKNGAGRRPKKIGCTGMPPGAVATASEFTDQKPLRKRGRPKLPKCAKCKKAYKPRYADNPICDICIREFTCDNCGIIAASQYGYYIGGMIEKVDSSKFCSECTQKLKKRGFLIPFSTKVTFIDNAGKLKTLELSKAPQKIKRKMRRWRTNDQSRKAIAESLGV